MGNAFAFTHNWVQWYEFTGTSGGSLWILAVNILLFNVLKNNQYSVKQLAKPIVLIIIPIIVSYIILASTSSATKINSSPDDTKEISSEDPLNLLSSANAFSITSLGFRLPSSLIGEVLSTPKMKIVGNFLTSYFFFNASFSSRLMTPTFTSPSNSKEISLNSGANRWHTLLEQGKKNLRCEEILESSTHAHQLT